MKKLFSMFALLLIAAVTTNVSAADYYLVMESQEWAILDANKFTANTEADGEYMLAGVELTTTDQFKVVGVDGETTTWYPDGMGNNYGENGEIVADGTYDIYFRPNADGGYDWFYNVIYVAEALPPVVDTYFDLTADFSSDFGDVKFYVGDEEVTKAKVGDEVSIVITPNEDYAVSSVTANYYTSWDGGEAPAFNPRSLNLVGEITLTGEGNTRTFTMASEYNVLVKVEFEYAPTYVLTITGLAANRYKTYCYGDNLKLAAESGAKLYTITALNGTTLTLTELTVVPAEMPFLILGDGEDINFKAATAQEAEAVTITPLEAFKGTLEETSFEAADMEAADYYVLNNNNFVWVMGAGSLGPNKCYLEFVKDNGASPAPALDIVIGEGTTHIDASLIDSVNDNVIYDLSGRRVANPTTGLYIMNGKKVILK